MPAPKPRAAHLEGVSSRDIFGVVRGPCSCGRCGAYIKDAAEYTLSAAAAAAGRALPDNDLHVADCSRCGCAPAAHAVDAGATERERGADAFQLRQWDAAVVHWSRAIDLGPADAVLYSNRAAAYLAKAWWPQALADAERCLALRPDWARGWGRKGGALLGMGRPGDAAAAFEAACRLEPGNATLAAGLAYARRAHERLQRRRAAAAGVPRAGTAPPVWTAVVSAVPAPARGAGAPPSALEARLAAVEQQVAALVPELAAAMARITELELQALLRPPPPKQQEDSPLEAPTSPKAEERELAGEGPGFDGDGDTAAAAAEHVPLQASASPPSPSDCKAQHATEEEAAASDSSCSATGSSDDGADFAWLARIAAAREQQAAAAGGGRPIPPPPPPSAGRARRPLRSAPAPQPAGAVLSFDALVSLLGSSSAVLGEPEPSAARRVDEEREAQRTTAAAAAAAAPARRPRPPPPPPARTAAAADRERRVAAARARAAEAEATGDVLQQTDADALTQARRLGCAACGPAVCPGFRVLYRSCDASDPEVMFYCSVCGCRAEAHAVDEAWRRAAEAERQRAEAAAAAAARARQAAAAAGAGGRGAEEAAAYAVLGLPPGADRRAVAAAFRRLALRLHPDKLEQKRRAAARGVAAAPAAAAVALTQQRFVAVARAYRLLLAHDRA